MHVATFPKTVYQALLTSVRFYRRNPRDRGVHPGYTTPFYKIPIQKRTGYEAIEPPIDHAPAKPQLSALDACSSDEPVGNVQNPYSSERRQCVLCKYNVPVDYKNSRLLSQFVSSFSGRIYDKHITGLCNYQQLRVYRAIKLSRRAGYMPVFYKDPRFLKDPKLFDPMRPIKLHPFY